MYVSKSGNSASTQDGSGVGLDPKAYDVPASMASATPKTTIAGEATPNTKWQNKMMPYDMLSGNNYPVGNMFSGYGGIVTNHEMYDDDVYSRILYPKFYIVGGPNFTRRPAINNSIYGRESRGIGPFLPRAPPAQTPIGSLMPKALSPYNLSPHGSQGLGSMTGVRL